MGIVVWAILPFTTAAIRAATGGRRRPDLYEPMQVGAAQAQLRQPRVVEQAQLLRGEGPLDTPVLDVDELIGQIHQVVEAMLRQHDGLALVLHLRQDVVQASYRLLVEIRRRLIHHEHAWSGRVNRAAGNLLLLAAGKLKDVAVHQRVELHVDARPVEPAAHLVTRQSLVLAAKHQLTCGVHVEELALGILKYTADKRRRVMELCGGGADVVHIDGTFHLALVEVGGKAVYQAREGRLSAPALADKHREGPVRYREIDMIDAISGAVLATVVKAHVIEANHRLLIPDALKASIQAATMIKRLIAMRSAPRSCTSSKELRVRVLSIPRASEAAASSSITPTEEKSRGTRMYSMVKSGCRMIAPGVIDMPRNAIALRTPLHSSCTVGMKRNSTARGMTRVMGRCIAWNAERNWLTRVVRTSKRKETMMGKKNTKSEISPIHTLTTASAPCSPDASMH